MIEQLITSGFTCGLSNEEWSDIWTAIDETPALERNTFLRGLRTSWTKNKDLTPLQMYYLVKAIYPELNAPIPKSKSEELDEKEEQQILPPVITKQQVWDQRVKKKRHASDLFATKTEVLPRRSGWL